MSTNSRERRFGRSDYEMAGSIDSPIVFDDDDDDLRPEISRTFTEEKIILNICELLHAPNVTNKICKMLYYLHSQLICNNLQFYTYKLLFSFNINAHCLVTQNVSFRLNKRELIKAKRKWISVHVRI